jgi:tripartite-type tricarboxylate transporter receptor subunit TctC
VNAAQRSAALPDIPTTREAGFADAEFPSWFGLFLPARTPREIVDRMHDATIKALRAPKVMEKLSALGVDPMMISPREFDALIRKDIAINAGLVRAAGITLN